jgi:murein DD-endopeptidase MepM/ murein hydrolase activator NlpD
VKEGQSVAKGQKIAEMGNTDADQVKLHFEVRQAGQAGRSTEVSTGALIAIDVRTPFDSDSDLIVRIAWRSYLDEPEFRRLVEGCPSSSGVRRGFAVA